MKRVLSVLLSLIIILGVLPVPSAQAAEGNWSSYLSQPLQDEYGTYLIETAQELAWVAQQTNAGTLGAVSVRLQNGIDLSAHYWTPIGTYASPFLGHFDGNNHLIYGLNITMSNTDNVGLFGYAAAVSTIQNVQVEGYVNGSDSVGLVLGRGEGTVSNCQTFGEVVGVTYVGGVVGHAYRGVVTGSLNRATVRATNGISGGISGGLSNGEISYCRNEGKIFGYETSNSGGIVASVARGSQVINCHNAGTFDGEGRNVGGITGANNGTLINVSNSAQVLGLELVAGIAAHSDSTIVNAYNSGDVSVNGSGDNQFIGGIVAFQQVSGLISNVYNTGSVHEDGGALVGYMSGGKIENGYWSKSITLSAVDFFRGDVTQDYLYSFDAEGILANGVLLEQELDEKALSYNQENPDAIPALTWQGDATAPSFKEIEIDIVSGSVSESTGVLTLEGGGEYTVSMATGAQTAMVTRLIVGDGASVTFSNVRMMAPGTATPVVHFENSGAATIVGDNHLISHATDGAALLAARGEGMITIGGDGTLLLLGGNGGTSNLASGATASLVIEDGVKITAHGANQITDKNPSAGINSGLYDIENGNVSGSVTLSGDAELISYGGSGMTTGRDGITGENVLVTVSDRAKLQAISGVTTTGWGSRGIYGNLNISGTAEVYLKGGLSSGGGDGSQGGWGIDASASGASVTMNGGKLSAIGGDGVDGAGGHAIAAALSISGDAIVTAIGGNGGETSGGHGIADTVTVDSGTVTATGGIGKLSGGSGIVSSNLRISSDSVVTAIGGDSETTGGDGVGSATGNAGATYIQETAQLSATGGGATGGKGGNGISSSLIIMGEASVVATAGHSSSADSLPFGASGVVRVEGGSLKATGSVYPSGVGAALAQKVPSHERLSVSAGDSAPGQEVTDLAGTDYHNEHYVYAFSTVSPLVVELTEIARAENYNKATVDALNPAADINGDGKINFLDLAMKRNTKYLGE